MGPCGRKAGRRAVLRLLEDSEWSGWSDREIARRCAVSPPTVSALRESICKSFTDSPSDRKVERNGTVYTQDTSRIGRTPRPVDRIEPEAETLLRPRGGVRYI